VTDPDSAELDAIKELRRSPGYQLVETRIKEELHRKRLLLEMQGPELPFAKTQGYIEALKTVLAIPEILENELKELK